MTIRGLDHVYYWTRDLDAAVAFYRDVVGLPLAVRHGNDWAELDAGPVRLALHGTEGDQIPASGTIVFGVDDLDAERWRLEQAGVVFDELMGEVEGRLRFATFHDPDGNPVQLIERI
ncbi:MAG: VOC family protein [Actinobacteria bacterium]|nr:VOC family protein [Actinomycetota bacterium]